MKKKRALEAPRNQPRQSRSRVTVSVILDAAVRIFEQEGSDAATTSRIAEVAGVSVGTLYQYFGNRDAILAALQDREFERASAMLERVLAEAGGATGRSVARAIVEELFKLYRAAPALHRVLAVEGLRVTPTERVLAFDARAVGAIKAFLTFGGNGIRRENLDAAAFVVYQSVRAVMLSYLFERPSGVDDLALTEELADLVERYLVEQGAPSRPRAKRSAGARR
jgi:AcrR family transcriptional regulator